ncbi:MAG: ABC transporter ATP-binding protein [Acidobacteria bacterium]|nr:ABC transporter ATP-binding protein [Acidobacteriota bacterium]
MVTSRARGGRGPGPVLRARDLHKRYGGGGSAVDALRGVGLELAAGEFVAVVGPSGCGKSTLLHLCGGMDRPTAGTVAVDGVDLAGLDDEALTALRRDRVGFVFQFFNLLPTLTLAENIALPLLLAGVPSATGVARAGEVARRVGLAHRLEHYPGGVSGGELQRAAVARAVVHRPALVIADEPTGNLDSDNGRRVLSLLRDLNRETGAALLLATHDPALAGAADRVLRLRDGVEDVGPAVGVRTQALVET